MTAQDTLFYDLARKLKSNRRKVLDHVSELRMTYSVKIGTARGEGGGLYLIQTEEELEETREVFRAEMLRHGRILRGLLGKHEASQMLGQLQLTIEGKAAA